MTEPSEQLPVTRTIQIHEGVMKVNNNSLQAKMIAQTKDRQSDGGVEVLWHFP